MAILMVSKEDRWFERKCEDYLLLVTDASGLSLELKYAMASLLPTTPDEHHDIDTARLDVRRTSVENAFRSSRW